MKTPQQDRTDRPMNRRKFLRTTGAATVAGVGILGTAGTAAAYPAGNFTLIDSAQVGSSSGQQAEIMLIGPDNGSARPPQQHHDHAETALGNLVSQSSELDGIWLTTYEHDVTMGQGTTLADLDDIISGHFTDGNDRIKVWDTHEQNYYPDGPGIRNDEGFINVSDPAISSSSIYSPVTGFSGNDGLGHNNMHVRCEVASVNAGRMTKAAIMALCRIHNHGEWNDSSSNLPKSWQTNRFTDLGIAPSQGTNWLGEDILQATAMGWFTQPDECNTNGPCQYSMPSNWTTTTDDEYLTQVTGCAAGHVDRAINYF